ncbi:hypothetical protein ACFQ73_02355 [Amycolatopsis japonica]|uniref:hypothetical protein n=1 Tax=Amycolatopsis japonica TaxID=208439 RepID=UPI0036708C38
MAVAVSFIAVLVSTLVFVHNRRTSRRDLLLNAHEKQLVPENQHGRRVVFELRETGGSPEALSAEDFRSANHALSSLNMLGFLCCRRYVSMSDAIALWGLTVVRVVAAAEETGFLALRDSQQEGTPVWPYLREFALIARSRSHLYLNPLRVAGFRRRPRFKAQLAPVADDVRLDGGAGAPGVRAHDDKSDPGRGHRAD